MIVKHPQTLKEFREKSRCEYCLSSQWNRFDPHHAFIKRGMGGGRRLDVRINLAALCSLCHGLAERDKVVRDIIREIVAEREGTTVDDVWEMLYGLLRKPKHAVRKIWGLPGTSDAFNDEPPFHPWRNT